MSADSGSLFGHVGCVHEGIFHEDPAMGLSAKKLFEHEWLKNH